MKQSQVTEILMGMFVVGSALASSQKIFLSLIGGFLLLVVRFVCEKHKEAKDERDALREWNNQGRPRVKGI